jgi:peptidyl-prolyl cis-trans isomerase SurA
MHAHDLCRRALVLCLALAATWTPHGIARASDLVEGVAAIVDNDVILLSELRDTAALLLARVQAQNAGAQLPPELVAQAQRDALQQLINQQLLLRFAERVNLTIDDAELDAAVAEIAADEGLTPEQVYASAEAEGLGRDEYRSELRKQIIQSQVMNGAIRGRVQISSAEIQKIFEERYQSVGPGLRAQVRQIFIPWPADDSVPRVEVRKVVEEVRQSAVQTGAMAELAQRYSRAPSAANGGLTVVREGDVPPEIAQWIFEPPVGSISPVVETSAGLNIFQVLGRFDPSEVKLEQVADGIRAELVDQRMQSELEKWLREQREQVYVEVVVPELR